MVIYKWHFSLTFAAKIMTKDYKYLISIENLLKASFNLFQIAQTVEILPNNIALLNR